MFSVKKLYSALQGPYQPVSWVKMISQNAIPAKYMFSTWLLLHGRLPTCQYLQGIGIHVEEECCLCNPEKETVDHLFFGCSYAQRLWRAVAGWSGINRQPRVSREELVYLLTQRTTKNGSQKLYKCVISVLIYYIWKERNHRIMQKRKCLVEEVMEECKVVLSICSSKYRKLRKFIQ